jgi:hypothetical protein
VPLVGKDVDELSPLPVLAAAVAVGFTLVTIVVGVETTLFPVLGVVTATLGVVVAAEEPELELEPEPELEEPEPPTVKSMQDS